MRSRLSSRLCLGLIGLGPLLTAFGCSGVVLQNGPQDAAVGAVGDGGTAPTTHDASTKEASSSPPPRHDDAGAPDSSEDARVADAGGLDVGGPDVSCPAPGADAGLYAYDTPASGTIEGPGLSGEFCNAGATVVTRSYLESPDMTYVQIFVRAFTFEAPQVVQNAELDITLQIPSASPGTYMKSSATPCSTAELSYSLPSPAGLDCTVDAGAGQCPPGCAMGGCPVSGCGMQPPCAPNPPSFGYTAAGGPGECLETTSNDTGSWTVTLTSVTPFDGDAGGTSNAVAYFTAHGTIRAQLLGGGSAPDAGSETATVSVRF
jgi:hypothetical protein